MNERNVSERIVRAVDTRLSGLTGDPGMARRVLARSKAAPVRRKKRAVALIVAAVLALAGVGALAASLLWRDQAASMKQIEQTGGDYAGWAIEDKAALVRALVDSGHLMQAGRRIASLTRARRRPSATPSRTRCCSRSPARRRWRRSAWTSSPTP